MINIYILRLKNEKYYVGRTHNINKRLIQHFECKGSVWTSMYKPISVDKIIIDCDKFDEDKYLFIYIKKYGIDNVRGGSFSTITLTNSDKAFIQKIIDNNNDVCYNCSSGYHFISKCKYKIIKDKMLLDIKNNIISNIHQINNMEEYIGLLYNVDKIMFTNITSENINKIITKINSLGLKNINISNDYDYEQITYGIILLLDKKN